MDQEPRKRRRGAALEAAIFEAARAELSQAGYTNFSVTSVAERAGTSKPVLYRRWPSRARLVHAAVVDGRRTIGEPADTGSLRGDLMALMDAMAHRTRRLSPDTIWGLLSESADDPELLGQVREELLDLWERPWMEALLARAAARGEVPDGERGTRQLGLPSELLRSEFLLRGAVGGDTVTEIVDEVLVPLFTGPT